MNEGSPVVPKKRLNYANKIIMAPMVRIGTLPMRLLALEYGADIVYTEELIDRKLLRSVRRENDILGTIDYVDETDGSLTFQTCEREREKVVLQIGTCSPERALQVGKMVENDVAGIDINMGCPKTFSIVGNMGAALLQHPETAASILKTLVDNLNIPVTCKIRVLPDLKKTIELCNLLVATGITAIAVHGRTVQERPQHSNRNHYLKEIARRIAIPVIANGGSREIQTHPDIFRFKEITGCSSVMLARAAEWNCSIFRKEGLLPMEDVIKTYLKYAVDCNNPPSNTKYCIQNILREQQESPLGRKFLGCQTLEQICACWDMEDYCRMKRLGFHQEGLAGRYQMSSTNGTEKSRNENSSGKRKLSEDEDDVVLMHCVFLRNSYAQDVQLPKSILHNWVVQQRKEMPKYQTMHNERLFRSIVTVDGQKFSSSYWEKNKKWAEQGAALACLLSLGLIDQKTYLTTGSAPS